MYKSSVCRALDEIDRDELYTSLKSELSREFLSEGESVSGEAYRRALSGVLEVLSNCEDLESDVNLNTECLVLIEDVATNGKCRYPWKVLKMLIMVVYNKLFDEVYKKTKDYTPDSSKNPPKVENSNLNSGYTSFSDFGKLSFSDSGRDFREEKEKSGKESPPVKSVYETEEEFRKLKLECLAYLLDFDLPPFTLQRICEIPLNQPYDVYRKLLNAYRKLFLVRNIEYEPEQLPDFFDTSQFPQLNRVYSNLSNWEKKYKDSSKEEWDQDLFCEFTDDIDFVEEKPYKRPLE